jgi:Fur family ferric uptake transcriptional regulator/Fur family peroxide stress response transcriptional regulator
MRYDGNLSQHAHFKCINCGAIYDLPIKNADFVELANTKNLTITESHFYYKGYCEKCAEQKNDYRQVAQFCSYQ